MRSNRLILVVAALTAAGAGCSKAPAPDKDRSTPVAVPPPPNTTLEQAADAGSQLDADAEDELYRTQGMLIGALRTINLHPNDRSHTRLREAKRVAQAVLARHCDSTKLIEVCQTLRAYIRKSPGKQTVFTCRKASPPDFGANCSGAAGCTDSEARTCAVRESAFCTRSAAGRLRCKAELEDCERVRPHYQGAACEKLSGREYDEAENEATGRMVQAALKKAFRVKFGELQEHATGRELFETDSISLRYARDGYWFGVKITPPNPQPYEVRFVHHLPTVGALRGDAKGAAVEGNSVAEPPELVQGPFTKRLGLDPGDPAGEYGVDVVINDFLIKSFKFKVRAP